MYWSEKLDGVYAFLIATDFGNAFFSRTGEFYSSMQNLADELVMLKNGAYIVELYNEGMIQADISGEARRHEPSSNLAAYVHDFLTLDEFVAGVSGRNFTWRTEHLPLVVDFEANLRFVLVTQHEMTFAEAVARSKAEIKRGAEGGIIRPYCALWQAGNRSYNLIRVKEKIEVELKCVGWYNGKGKRAAPCIGGLILEDASGKQYQIGGGKWFTIKNMMEFYRHPLLDYIFQCSAMRYTRDGMLREPRVDCQRFDKGEPDDLS